jgi:glycerol uptake facilitator-like aquaporin
MKKNLAEFRGTFLLFIVIPIAGAMLAGFVYKYLKL